jgi:hypothetical protein
MAVGFGKGMARGQVGKPLSSKYLPKKFLLFTITLLDWHNDRGPNTWLK